MWRIYRRGFFKKMDELVLVLVEMEVDVRAWCVG